MFTDELGAGNGEAARNMAEALRAGRDYGAGACGQRVPQPRHVARCHGLEFPSRPGGADAEAGDGRPGQTAGGRRRG
jgi:hypothetical protein